MSLADRTPDGEGGGEGTPAFARSFPADTELQALVVAFAAGNYRHVRQAAPKLARRTTDDAVARAARELVARTEADPLAKVLLLLTLGLLIALAGFWTFHSHG